jgi:hypothetical protein
MPKTIWILRIRIRSLDRLTFFSSRSFFPAAAAVSLVVAAVAAAEPLLTPLPLHNRIVKILLQSPDQFSHLFIVLTFPSFLKAALWNRNYFYGSGSDF